MSYLGCEIRIILFNGVTASESGSQSPSKLLSRAERAVEKILEGRRGDFNFWLIASIFSLKEKNISNQQHPASM